MYVDRYSGSCQSRCTSSGERFTVMTALASMTWTYQCGHGATRRASNF